MLSIQSYVQSNTSSIMRNINREDSILIIGKGKDEKNLNDFIRPTGRNDMREIYGDCELTSAYEHAFAHGARNIFVMNCYKTTDFIESMSFASNYNFAYVVPIGIKLSDKFYSIDYQKEMYFAEYYLKEFSKHTNSTIIFTDEHARLYENIDHFMGEMHRKVLAFKDQSKYILEESGRNLAFCLNNINSVSYSNVILAAKLCSINIGEYPSNIDLDAIFDLDSEDIYSDEIIYFKNNYHTKISIENLKNFRVVNDANKLIVIDRVIKYIEKTIDTSFVVGKLYSQYVKMNLHDYLDMFFRKLIGFAIRNYQINEISFTASKNMTGYLTANIDIFPINSLEKVEAMMEVK